MRLNRIILAAFLAALLPRTALHARPTTARDAGMAVAGWVRASVRPLGADVGGRVAGTETFTGPTGAPVYYVVYLQPSGFVIASADDSLEPIIGFADDGTYDPSPDNPLAALVTADLDGRTTGAGNTIHLLTDLGANTPGGPQAKWRRLKKLAENPADGYELMSLTCVSDIRVAPLVRSKWGQTTACGENTYNYYTPENYPCGCAATALAQVMRYYEYPTVPIGVNEFLIQVADKSSEKAYTRGAEGLGGAYIWSNMVLRPEANCEGLTEAQRQAIGALCYDAGVAVSMSYRSSGSGAFMSDVKDALVTTFQYSNAVLGYSSGREIHSGMSEMINPNLDAGAPVILAISGLDPDAAHAVVCDGYGYESSTLYHHLNMGWNGVDDIWYNLPNIDATKDKYTTVFGVIYNISPSGSGEIVSGRVLDPDGNPIAGARVFAEPGGRSPAVGLSNDRGIYAIENLRSDTVYKLRTIADGYVFSDEPVEAYVRKSTDQSGTSGNCWGIHIYAEQVLDPPQPAIIYVDDDAATDPGPGDPALSDPLENGSFGRPFDALQEAIDVAFSGDTVLIMDGTYTGEGNRDLDFKGKAITVRSAEPNTPGLVIIDCNATAEDPHRGFDFHSYETDRSVLEAVTVIGGYHDQGGAIRCSDCAAPTVRNCAFENNHASLGGAVYAESSPTLIDCTFGANSADAGGALYNNGNESECGPTVTACVFSGNSATHNGGAVYNLGRRAKPVLTNCRFVGNSVSGGGGGAIRNNLSGSPSLTNCLFAGNSAATSGGAIRNSNGGNTKLTNCTFGRNSAINGAAVASTPDDSDSHGPCVLQVVNCILWDGSDEIFNNDGSVIDVTFSNVQLGSVRGPFPGQGNIGVDPRFADPDNGNYYLKSEAGRWNADTQSWVLDDLTSPCIDAGDAFMAVGDEPAPNGGIINMGAYGGTFRASKSLSGGQ